MKKDKKTNIFHRRLDYNYPLIVQGKGIYLQDIKGKKYIDAVGGALVANLGHGIPEIAEEIKKLAQRFSYLHGAQFSTKEMEDYARELCKIAPKGLKRVLFVSGGSEAIETAVKLARQYHYDLGKKKKWKVIRRIPAYHGATILALSLSSKKSARKPQSPYLLRFPAVPAPFCYHCPFKTKYPQCRLKCAWELERVIKKEKPETISAFILEPVMGATAGGAIVPPKEYFKIVQKICKKYNILVIADEIIVGFGRTGKWFACEHFGFSPDIIAVGKGISGGFVPLAAVFCKEKIVKTIKKGSGNFIHGFTFENNPFTTGVGKIVLSYMKKKKLVEKCAERGRYLLKKLKKELGTINAVGDIRGIGLITAVEFVQDRKTKKPFPRKKQIAEKIVQKAMKKGLNLYFSIGFVDGVSGDAILVAPSFNTTKKEIDKIVEIFKKTILETLKEV